ncbi:uncharacterized protein PHALS_07570 [Plasmopara halstedii]|uniref:Uncharacterized protein n=1 Tax=Plasmopara halstedii TaxID=4781 RepID=A0A0P1B5U4_PLAHL|nr:uncharacterized protein PHALS_07570 [Plasmopara halstedii]CEG49829.1 hypothetical protein PHALS_07570 [Plasmopara halstedii]|eukprot:XP_024586198.1 hypothetical protein PHALS_07570 [Plasmopara halstedii]
MLGELRSCLRLFKLTPTVGCPVTRSFSKSDCDTSEQETQPSFRKRFYKSIIIHV